MLTELRRGGGDLSENNLSDEQGKNGMVGYEVGRPVLSKYLRILSIANFCCHKPWIFILCSYVLMTNICIHLQA
jgi:hypothetical protein